MKVLRIPNEDTLDRLVTYEILLSVITLYFQPKCMCSAQAKVYISSQSISALHRQHVFLAKQLCFAMAECCVSSQSRWVNFFTGKMLSFWLEPVFCPSKTLIFGVECLCFDRQNVEYLARVTVFWTGKMLGFLI